MHKYYTPQFSTLTDIVLIAYEEMMEYHNGL